MEKALVITGLTKLYRNGRGIKDINLTINQGDIVGILGPNGAGKTTLLKCLTGLAFPDSGKVEVFGKELGLHFKEAIQEVGALVGPVAAFDYMSPYQNLKMAARFYPALPIKSIDRVLEQTGLARHKHEKIASFSMGMKQRFGIAAALLSNPRLVILDEPTNGLDLDALLQFRKTVQEIAASTGVTFVISSHHISELEKLCNRYCFLINGLATVYESGNLPLEEMYIKRMEDAANEYHTG